jgi:hypothetical protein
MQSTFEYFGVELSPFEAYSKTLLPRDYVFGRFLPTQAMPLWLAWLPMRWPLMIEFGTITRYGDCISAEVLEPQSLTLSKLT